MKDIFNVYESKSDSKARTPSKAKFKDLPYQSSTALIDDAEFIKDNGLCQIRALWGIIALCLSTVLAIITFSLSASVLHEDYSWNQYLNDTYFKVLQNIFKASSEDSRAQKLETTTITASDNSTTNSSTKTTVPENIKHLQTRHHPMHKHPEKLSIDDFQRQLATYLIGVMFQGFSATCLFMHSIIYYIWNNDGYRVKFGKIFCIVMFLCELVSLILSVNAAIEYNEKYEKLGADMDSVKNFTNFGLCKLSSGDKSLIIKEVQNQFVCFNYTFIFVVATLLAIVCVLLISVALLLKSRKAIYIEEKAEIPDLESEVPLPLTITIEVAGSETSSVVNLNSQRRKKPKRNNEKDEKGEQKLKK